MILLGRIMTFDRRRFLKTVSAGALGAGVASPMMMSSAAIASPLQKKMQTADSPVFNLGLAAYSFKPHFAFYKGEPVEPLDGRSIDMFQFIDYCADQNCAAELTSYFFPPDADEAYFRKIKRYAFVNGVPIVGTAIGNNFTLEKGEKLDQQIADAKLWIDRAVQMGAPHIRFFAGKRKEVEEAPERMKNAIEAVQECVDYAAKAGVFIGVENHGNLTADHVIQIISSIDSEWLGVNLDSGNFVTGDVYDEMARCAPYAINVQIKVKMKTETKGVKIDCDIPRVANIFKESNYRGFVVMEYEEENPFEEVPKAMDVLRKNFTL
jgi:sugar phosphate isomerase/epimerase